jgi:hypothetical protein
MRTTIAMIKTADALSWRDDPMHHGRTSSSRCDLTSQKI